MKYLVKNNNGFTLLEILVALVIFAVGILGAYSLQISSITGNSKSRQVSEATYDGADRIEQFVSLDYNDPLLDDDDGDGVVDGDENGTGQDNDGDGVDDDGGNFGLDDLTNPDGAADRDGDGTDDIFWNVAVDHPILRTKTIKFHVDPPGSGKRVELIFVKADII